SENAHSLVLGRQTTHLGLLAPRPDHEEVGPVDAAERLDELNGALDRLEASSEHESRPALMGKLVAKSTEILGPEEGRQHLDVTGGERVLVQLGSKPAEGDDRVQLVDHRLQQASGAPKLRRSSVRERATPAG